MEFDPAELDALSREDLILRARARGVERPEQMTRVELRDEIVRLSEPDLERQRRTRGWLGVARDLLASVVESGLNLPDAAAAIRGDSKADIDLQGPPPVATVTLAEIYATQSHYEKALRMLDEVLEREPEHAAALALRKRLIEQREQGPARRRAELRSPPVERAAPQPEPPPIATSEPPVQLEEGGPPAAPPPLATSEPTGEATQQATIAAPPEPARAPAEPAPAEPAPAEPAPAEPAPAEPAPAAAEPAPAAAEPRAPAAAAPVATSALIVLRADDRAFVYWRLPELTQALRLRAITVRPGPEGPAVDEEEHQLTLPVGGFWLGRLEQGSEVRAVIGELSGNAFAPFAVARVVADDGEVSFDPLGGALDAGLESDARIAAGV